MYLRIERAIKRDMIRNTTTVYTYISTLENMQNYCEYIISHAKLQLHNIRVSPCHVDTNLR